jgi:hypothetical protein
MKKLLGIIAIAFTITACGGNDKNDESLNKQYMTDTTQTSEDLSMGDTTDLNGPRGDSSSASGIHGGGSGSRTGGGKTGAPQENGADKK